MTNPPDPKTKTPRTDKCLSQYDDFGQYRSEPRRLELLAIESSTLELENQSLTRRLEEAEKERERLREAGRQENFLVMDLRSKLTALRTAAEGASKALEAILNYRLQLPAGLRPQGELALAALRAELDQADSNASNSPTDSRESQG